MPCTHENETEVSPGCVCLPLTQLTKQASEFIRDTEDDLLFNHSSRVYCFGAMSGRHRGLVFDAELLYVAAMFHDIGLTPRYRSASNRFEIDGANAAAEFLRSRGIAPELVYDVWTAVALHTTPQVPYHMSPVVQLVTAGVEMDVLGLTYADFTDDERSRVTSSFPRPTGFKELIIQAFYDGIKDKPESTFGNVKADVLADKDPKFVRGNFCSVIRQSRWES